MQPISVQELLLLIGDREAQLYLLRKRIEELEKQLRESEKTTDIQALLLQHKGSCSTSTSAKS